MRVMNCFMKGDRYPRGRNIVARRGIHHNRVKRINKDPRSEGTVDPTSIVNNVRITYSSKVIDVKIPVNTLY